MDHNAALESSVSKLFDSSLIQATPSTIALPVPCLEKSPVWPNRYAE